MRRAEDAIPALLDVSRETQRRLSAELGDDADGLLAVAHRQHLLRGERLEVEAVGGVVVGRDGLRVAVDHHGLVAERAEGLGGVDAAVVELDSLADAVRARPEDDHARRVSGRGRLVLLAPGRVEVVGRSVDLAGAGVDPAKDGPDAELVPAPTHLGPADPERLSERVVPPAGALRGCDVAAGQDRARSRDLLPKPRMQPLGKILVGEARPRRRRPALELARSVRLEERLRERTTDAHRLADRLHLRAECLVGTGELLEGETRELDDDVVERRLEARGRCLRQVVGDLVERVADGELRGDLRDRDSPSPWTPAPTSARRAGSSRSPAARRCRGCVRTGCSSRPSRPRPRG